MVGKNIQTRSLPRGQGKSGYGKDDVYLVRSERCPGWFTTLKVNANNVFKKEEAARIRAGFDLQPCVITKGALADINLLELSEDQKDPIKFALGLDPEILKRCAEKVSRYILENPDNCFSGLNNVFKSYEQRAIFFFENGEAARCISQRYNRDFDKEMSVLSSLHEIFWSVANADRGNPSKQAAYFSKPHNIKKYMKELDANSMAFVIDDIVNGIKGDGEPSPFYRQGFLAEHWDVVKKHYPEAEGFRYYSLWLPEKWIFDNANQIISVDISKPSLP